MEEKEQGFFWALAAKEQAFVDWVPFVIFPEWSFDERGGECMVKLDTNYVT